VAGGDANHVAIIRLNPNDVTDANSLNDVRMLAYRAMTSRTPPSVRIEQMGSDIINSISVHKLQGDEEAGTTDDVVAVLTNNDKTVRVFSLTQHTQNSVMDLPFAVNHATISPDGRTLVAVGDYPQAYFYDRVDLKPSPDYKSQKPASANCMWELFSVVRLHSPLPTINAGYFTTAWSPSGRHCSVSSELGYVTILDMEVLRAREDGEEATAAVVPSTRPDTAIGPGGVRTTAFSPQPWDLLVWSEDQGRVVVADLRTGLGIRQVLSLDPEQEGLRHIEVEDHPANPYSRVLDANLEAEFLHQYRRPPGTEEELALDAADTYLTAERRRIARAASRLQEDGELTANERQVVEALSTRRQREDSLSRSPAPRSIYYGPSELSGESRRSTAQQSSLFAQDFSGLTRNSESSTSTGANTLSLPPASSEYTRNRQSTQVTATDRGSPFYSPRRQASILITNNDADETLLLNLHTRGASSSQTQHAGFPAHHRPSSTSFPDWARIPDPMFSERVTQTLPPSSIVTSTAERAEALRLRRPSPPPPVDASPEVHERRRRAIIRARERVLSVRENERFERHQLALNHRNLSRGDIYDRGLGIRSAGLAISWDGRKIWAACDRGIFEYEVNVRRRMMSPAVEMR
jgi:hypothetical protein